MVQKRRPCGGSKSILLGCDQALGREYRALLKQRSAQQLSVCVCTLTALLLPRAHGNTTAQTLALPRSALVECGQRLVDAVALNLVLARFAQLA
jgi:hypothetical protein